jgi:hypothetical protein
MEVNNKTIGYAAAGFGALALAYVVYRLSQDDSAPLDPKGKHSLEKLKQLLAETKLEYTCIYARNYNIMMRTKDAGEFNENLLSQLEALVGQEIEQKTEEICKYNQANGLKLDDLTKERFGEWVTYFASDPVVKEQAETIQSLHEDVFKRQEIKHIDYQNDIPKEFTKELYIKTFRKIWAAIRHDIYVEIKALNGKALNEEIFAKIYNEVHERFERIRTDIYCLMMDLEDLPEGKAREIMQKAYVSYATVTHIKTETGGATASRWPDQVQEILKKHGQYI